MAKKKKAKKSKKALKKKAKKTKPGKAKPKQARSRKAEPRKAERVQAKKLQLSTIGQVGFPQIEDIEKEKKELLGEEGSEDEKEYQDVSGYDEDLEESVVEEAESSPDAWDEDEL